jgi:hypothetical protein
MKPGVVVLFGLASFLAAVLLFTVQPMIGKMVLPDLGGVPAVWNTCLVYFQAMLLCGYLLVHAAGHTAGIERRRVSFFYLVALAALFAAGYMIQPIALQSEIGWRSPAFGSPALDLFAALCRWATLPLVVVSATAPLMQCWFALSGHYRARDPYFLYAASNAGSLLALLTYPLVIEPNVGLAVQSRIWRTGFLVLAILVLTCGVIARSLSRSHPAWNLGPEPDRQSDSAQDWADTGAWGNPGLHRRFQWLMLVFIPSSWLLGVTTYLTTDLAPVPLFWTIPLALYLLSFILVFARSTAGVARAASFVLPFSVVPLVLVFSAGFRHIVWIPLHLIVFFIGCVACHGALAQARPPARHVTSFYLAIAVGGLLGGIWSALIAPALFNRFVEYPSAVVLACAVAPGIKARPDWRVRRDRLSDLVLPGVVFLLGAALVTNQAGLVNSALGALCVAAASGLGFFACVTARRRPLRFALTVVSVLAVSGLAPDVGGRLLHIERNFFGVVRVTSEGSPAVHRLFHGSTLHGQQSFDPALRRRPSTYFTRSGPIGQVYAALEPLLSEPEARVAIVGLGAGTLASYAWPGQRWTFYVK